MIRTQDQILADICLQVEIIDQATAKLNKLKEELDATKKRGKIKPIDKRLFGKGMKELKSLCEGLGLKKEDVKQYGPLTNVKTWMIAASQHLTQ